MLHSCLAASVAVADASKRAAVSRLEESIPVGWICIEFARSPYSWTKSVRSVLVFGLPYRKGMAPMFVELALQT